MKKNREISQQTWCVALLSITQASRAIIECEKEEEEKILPMMCETEEEFVPGIAGESRCCC